MGRRPEFKGLQKEAEFFSGIFHGQAQGGKNFLLHFAVVYTNAAAAQFFAV